MITTTSEPLRATRGHQAGRPSRAGVGRGPFEAGTPRPTRTVLSSFAGASTDNAGRTDGAFVDSLVDSLGGLVGVHSAPGALACVVPVERGTRGGITDVLRGECGGAAAASGRAVSSSASAVVAIDRS